MSKELIIKLTLPELRHIQNLLLANEEDGTYFPPKKQYWDRHIRILDKISKSYDIFMKGKQP